MSLRPVHALRGWRSRRVIRLHVARTACGLLASRVQWSRLEGQINCRNCLWEKPCALCGARGCDCLGEVTDEAIRPGIEDELAPHVAGLHEGER